MTKLKMLSKHDITVSVNREIMMSVTGPWYEDSVYASCTGISSGTGHGLPSVDD